MTPAQYAGCTSSSAYWCWCSWVWPFSFSPSLRQRGIKHISFRLPFPEPLHAECCFIGAWGMRHNTNHKRSSWHSLFPSYALLTTLYDTVETGFHTITHTSNLRLASPRFFIPCTHVDEETLYHTKSIALDGFDPSTFGLWAQRASPAPQRIQPLASDGFDPSTSGLWAQCASAAP